MSWYYVRGQERIGPIEAQQFDALINDGTITSETHVWRDGMGQWQRFGEINYSPGASRAAQPYAPAVQANPICAECGLSFSKDEMVHYGNQWVCAACKPVFFQRVKEGVLPGALNYAGFWIRFAAIFADGILTNIVTYIIAAVVGVGMGVGGSDDPSTAAVAGVIGTMFSIVIPCAYETYMVGRFGATLGKMAAGIKVVSPDGSGITYLRAFGRYWAKALSGLILGIGYFMAAFDDEKRALHDRLCNTRVVKK